MPSPDHSQDEHGTAYQCPALHRWGQLGCSCCGAPCAPTTGCLMMCPSRLNHSLNKSEIPRAQGVRPDPGSDPCCCRPHASTNLFCRSRSPRKVVMPTTGDLNGNHTQHSAQNGSAEYAVGLQKHQVWPCRALGPPSYRSARLS